MGWQSHSSSRVLPRRHEALSSNVSVPPKKRKKSHTLFPFPPVLTTTNLSLSMYSRAFPRNGIIQYVVFCVFGFFIASTIFSQFHFNILHHTPSGIYFDKASVIVLFPLLHPQWSHCLNTVF
jgi:hypothetical protein